MKDNQIIARVIADLTPDTTVLVVTDREGRQFVIAYAGISGDVPAMYRRRGYKVALVTELEAAS